MEHVKNNLISAGELVGLFQVMTAVAAKVTKASRMEMVKTIIKVPQLLHKQLLWQKWSPLVHPALNLEASVSTSGYEHS